MVRCRGYLMAEAAAQYVAVGQSLFSCWSLPLEQWFSTGSLSGPTFHPWNEVVEVVAKFILQNKNARLLSVMSNKQTIIRII